MRYERTSLDIALSDALREAMRVHFASAIETVDDFGNPVFTIAPRVPEFGPMVAELSPGSGFTLSIGLFAHTHFDADTRDAPTPRELADALILLCKDVMNDDVVVYRTPWGGGFGRPSWLERALLDTECWRWSGPVTPAHLRSTE